MIESKIFYPESGPVTAGKMLSFAREEWDLSVADVASNLNLGVATIDALERDQYDLLPGYTFVKGYARAYAILLRLNPDEVTKRMDLKPESYKITISKSTRLRKYQVCDRTNKSTKKSGGVFLKSMLVIIFLVGVSLFGLNQLSHLDTEKLAVLLKLPILAKVDHVAEDANEILFPIKQNSASQTSTALE